MNYSSSSLSDSHSQSATGLLLAWEGMSKMLQPRRRDNCDKQSMPSPCSMYVETTSLPDMHNQVANSIAGSCRSSIAGSLAHDLMRKGSMVLTTRQNPALMATKTSICLFYLTLSKNQKVFRWTTVWTLVVVNVAGLALTFLNIFQCRPIQAAFSGIRNENAQCIDIVTLYLSSAPVNIVTDLALLFLPMPILTGMKLPRNEKFILVATFSFGGFVAAVDVVRIAYLESAALARLQDQGINSPSTAQQGDYSWIASLSFMWSAVEVQIGIICACVPGVKPLVAKVFPSLLGSIKKAGDLSGNPFYGPGDAQWANMASGSQQRDSRNGPRSPLDPPLRSPTGRDSARLASPPRSPIYPPRSPLDGGFNRRSTGPPVRFSADSEKASDDAGHEMGMMDFLTTPDTTYSEVQAHQTRTATTTAAPARPRTPSLTVFDFVNMKNPGSMTKMGNKESMFPLALVTMLFFLWGFAYGLLDILNQQFQLVVGINQAQAIGLHSAYYGAYFVAPLTFGHIVFRRWGFKSTFMTGLCIYGVGALVFWPSAVLASFPAFLISNFIIGLGVATLETAGNPFIALCGPPEYAEVRLNISQGVQAIGTVVSPILAKKVFFRSVNDAPSLIDVQWAYLGIALFVVILALVFFYLPIPEASDDELEALAQRQHSQDGDLSFRNVTIGGVPIMYLTLALGVLSNFCYVGGQEAVSTFFQQYLSAYDPTSSTSPFYYQAVGHTVFALGRFLTAALNLYIKPRRILLCLFLACIVTTALATHLTGPAGAAMLVLTLLFESGIFSLIFAISIRGMGRQTKLAAVVLTAATSGGAVVTPILYPVTATHGLHFAFLICPVVFAFGTIFPAYLATVPAAKNQVDPVRCSTGETDVPPSSSSRRSNKVFLNALRQRKHGRDPSRTSTGTAGQPKSEHVEGRTQPASTKEEGGG